MQTYLIKDGQQSGPFGNEELRLKIEAGECSAQTMAWRESAEQWQPLGILASELFSLSESVPAASSPIPPPEINNNLKTKARTMFCRTCAKELPENAVACIQCGCPPLIGKKHCQSCGAETLEHAVICVKCGCSLHTRSLPSLQGSRTAEKTTLCLLTFFLGGIGVHKFYAGNWGWGLIYLVFFWTFIPGIAALVEFIRYLTKDEASLQQAYEQIRGKPFGFLW
ncbi:NINE protein [Prosthecobacter dejongeii]|uniref:TM2 domain-containing membrane protein YozV/ribosomal protein L40E n=1 Tax=Prosthecobacter dejongeii TaxID=48465 RepID=A0A7W7YMM9_9BACT|nr:NINE protein [Prosthecobacter dejongeii]MBB5038983.1 TM2 domain-containing membrane protein YozV/ribosomal protein L40E [Prosthecobacter dejongeii]